MGKTTRNLSTKKLIKVYATFSVAFLLSFIISSITSPVSNSTALDCNSSTSSPSEICGTDTADVNVSITGAWTISVSSAGTLDLDITPNSSGVLSTITDNLNVYTNTPNGYQLYLNSTSGSTDIYNSSDTSQELNHFTSTTGTKESPVTLSSNTWGYSLATSPTAFSKVETTSDTTDSNIYTNPTKTSTSGDNIPVTYGFKADTKLTPGTYSTQVTYTAIADIPGYSITSVSPNTLPQNDQTDKTITIITSTPVTELAFGDITAKITDGTNTVDLIDCTETTQEVSGISYRGATCTYTGDLPSGYYNVELTSSWHNATYTLPDAFAIMSYLTVSGGTGSGWYAPNSTINISASACSSGYTFDNWTTTGGTLSNANSPSTTIITTAGDITVTRSCKAASCTVLSTNGTATINGYAVKKLADGKCWMTSNLRSGVTWPNRGSCPSGYTFPSKADFEALAGRYSGSGLYSAWGLSSTSYFWSSSVLDNTYAYLLRVMTSGTTIYHYSKTAGLSIRCYTTR